MVQIACGEINYKGEEHQRICRGFSPNLAKDFVVISRAEFERILGDEILHFWKCTRFGGIEVDGR